MSARREWQHPDFHVRSVSMFSQIPELSHQDISPTNLAAQHRLIKDDRQPWWVITVEYLLAGHT